MHPMIPQLAKRYGVQLSDRIAIDTNNGLPPTFKYSNAIYNGKDLATRVQNWECVYDDDDNVKEVIKTKVVDQLDHMLLHDIAHYVVAKEEQKDLPEFGLGSPVYGEPLGSDFQRTIDCVPSVVELGESDIQEYMAQLLSIMWGKEYGISPKNLDDTSRNNNHPSYRLHVVSRT
jgi:hypothetical protein